MVTPTASSASEQAVFLRKWVGFVSALWLMVFSGCYTFSNYSTALKEVLGLNQKQLNALSIARDLGDSCIGILAGIFSSHLPVWALFCISACFGVVGYGVEWLVVSDIINPLPYWVMFIAAFASGSAVCWMNVAVFNVSVRSFVRNRGPVSGLFKACMGLSAAVFFLLGDILFSNSASMYLLMLMTIPTASALISAIFFRPVPSAETQEEQQAEQKSLFVFNTMASMLAILIAILALLPSKLKENLFYKVFVLLIFVGILGALAFVPFVMLFKMKRAKSKSHRNSIESNLVAEFNQHEGASIEQDDQAVFIDRQKNGLDEPLLDNNASVYVLTGKQLRSNPIKWCCCNMLPLSSFLSARDLGEDKSTLSLFKSWHFYVFYISSFCGCGSGIVFCNNLGQVSQSLGSDSADLFASFFSLGNVFGRIASGNASEYFLRGKGVPRPAFMGMTKIPMIVLFLWLSTGSETSLYTASLLLGFCHGSLVTLSIPIISEFYGLKHFGTNFMVSSTFLFTGSYIFSSLAGYLYDRQAVLEDDSSSLTCYGSNCYSTTFQILACCLAFALVCDVVLTTVSRPLYRKLHLVTK